MAEDPIATEKLLVRAQSGDATALESLCERFLPRLRRWASRRLPSGARDLADTHDLVQDVMFEAFRRLETFEIRGQGAFIAYLRRALLNRVSNEIRRAGRRPVSGTLEEDPASAVPSALDEVLGREAVAWYESALQALSETDRTAIVCRLELDCSYDELAQILNKPSPPAARQTVSRALRRLAEEMGRARRA